jgi:hypothetical protein
MKFYNVKKRKSVLISDSKCTKLVYTKGDKATYAVKAIDDDGTPLTAFVKKAFWDNLECSKA